ncbi:MAG: MFS transporter, partial [Eubacteriales bacterium]|nr:MFS transporter [Eubacteriales bacterium]
MRSQNRKLHWPRIRLFDDRGMAQEMRKGLYCAIWAVTASMLGSVVTTGAVWSGFQRNILRANDMQIGLIAAIPVAANVLQLFISYYMERKRNRRFLFLFFGLVGRFFWIPIGLVPYLFPGFSVDLRIWLVIVFVVLISCGNCFVNLGFGSLMGDLVPMRIRGQYFSVRSKFSLICGIAAGLLVSVLVDRLGNAGYTIALVLAGVSMMVDISCFFGFEWPEMPATAEAKQMPSFGSMFKEVFQNKSFMRVVLSFTAWQFASNIAAPFWNVYALEDLQMSYTNITLFSQIVSNISTVLIISRWGRLMDRYGNKPVLELAAVFCVLAPLPWFFATPAATIYVLISNIISGAAWPVTDICQQNLYLSESPATHRSMYIAVLFASINLLGVALGNTVGGYLMQDVFSVW